MNPHHTQLRGHKNTHVGDRSSRITWKPARSLGYRFREGKKKRKQFWRDTEDTQHVTLWRSCSEWRIMPRLLPLKQLFSALRPTSYREGKVMLIQGPHSGNRCSEDHLSLLIEKLGLTEGSWGENKVGGVRVYQLMMRDTTFSSVSLKSVNIFQVIVRTVPFSS